MASKAISQGEADLEPKLREAGSPPWSFGLGNTQLACLFSPPKLLSKLPRLLFGEAKLGFLTKSPKGCDWPWPQLGCMASLEFNPAGAGWVSILPPWFLVVPKVASLKKLLDATHKLLRQKLCYHAKLGGEASFSMKLKLAGLSHTRWCKLKLVQGQAVRGEAVIQH